MIAHLMHTMELIKIQYFDFTERSLLSQLNPVTAHLPVYIM